MNYDDASNQKLYDELTHFLADRFEVDRSEIHPKTALREDLSLEDSELGAFISDLSEFVEYVGGTEIFLPAGWLNLAVTVEDLFDLVRSALSVSERRIPQTES